jgi:hypothetical protein
MQKSLNLTGEIGTFNRCEIQWKPLNVITLGQVKTDNINRLITISKLKISLY